MNEQPTPSAALTMEQLLQIKSKRELDIGTHISLKNRYVYFQVSKSASSTVKGALQALEVEGTSRKVVNVNNRNLSPHIWPSQLTEEMFLSILKDRSFRKFSFVRNPYSRILSCYLHRIVAEPHSASNKALKIANSGRGGPDISFFEFVSVICEQKSSEQESHWRAQADEIFYDLIQDWAFIGRVEELATDIDKMNSIILGRVPSTSNELGNLSPMTTGASEKLKSYYDIKTRIKVLERYERDFTVFGYSEKI